MTAITFEVTDSATDPSRLNTEQTLTLDGVYIISEFQPAKNMNRTHSKAMDGKSGQGTYIAKTRSFSITITYPDTREPQIEELIDSLADYQICSFEALDIPRYKRVQNVKMMSNDFSPVAIGCTHASVTIQFDEF